MSDHGCQVHGGAGASGPEEAGLHLRARHLWVTSFLEDCSQERPEETPQPPPTTPCDHLVCGLTALPALCQ